MLQQRSLKLCGLPQDERHAHRLHMCGLCHALGDGYGLPHRLLTTHEAILLNLLASAQRAGQPEVVMRRCPLNPLLHVPTNRDSASAFAAAISISLAAASLDDHVVDSAGRDLPARLLHGALRPAYRAALRLLDGLGASPAPLIRLAERQAAAEQTTPAAADLPTAHASASLFAQTAALAGAPHNAAPLETLGASYGKFLYWNDAYHDLRADLRAGSFNPLARYAQGGPGLLSEDGRRWLLGEVQALRAAILGALPQVAFARSRALVARMLLDPISALIADLGGRAHGRACHTHAPPPAEAIRWESRRRQRKERAPDDCECSPWCYWCDPNCGECCRCCHCCDPGSQGGGCDCCPCDGDGCSCDGGGCDCGSCDCGGCDC